MFPLAVKRDFRVTAPIKFLSFSSFSSVSSSSPASSDPKLVAASILKHHRSKSRWTHIAAVFPSGFTPSQASQIILQLRNNPHLALRFFLFTHRNALCVHSLSSYSTIIHVLSRSRLKSHAQSLIRCTLTNFHDTNFPNSSYPPPIFETLIKTYRSCDSAPFVFDLLIKACLQAKRIDQSVEIVRMLRSKGIYPRTSTCNSLIELVSKNRGCYAGFDMYREILGLDGDTENGNGGGGGGGVRMVVPNARTYTILMVAFYREGLIEKVEEIWGEMMRMNCAPDAYGYSVMMAAYCENGKMENALVLWKEQLVKGVRHGVIAYNTIIGGFCRIGEVGRAEEFFRRMEISGVEATCITLEHLINGYCKLGDVDTAMLLYKDMCRRSFKPESSTIDVVIRGLCEKIGVSQATEFMKGAIKEHEVVPKRFSYQFLIEGLCQEGQMEEALKLQVEMVRKGYEPDSDLYNVFIDGYIKQGNEELAEKLRMEMLKSESPD